MNKAEAEQTSLKRSILVTVVISALGVTFGLLSGSLSIVFDGVFSSVDAAMITVSLYVARLVAGEGNRRFQYGYWHIEPMVLVFNGAVMVLLCFYAFINAVGGLLKGGRELDFDWAIIYAVVVSAICFGMFFFTRRINSRIGSEFISLDSQSWLMSASISSALLVAFVIAMLIDGTAYDYLRPFVDPAVLAVLALCIMPVPYKTIRNALREMLMITPSGLDRRVRDIMNDVVARHDFKSYASYVAKVGRATFIEIHVVTQPGFAVAGGVAALDAVRAEIGEAIGEAGPHRWLTIAFTADENWT